MLPLRLSINCLNYIVYGNSVIKIAIEYFESIKSDKFLIFKNRTQALLMRQTVNQCMHIAYEERMVEE